MLFVNEPGLAGAAEAMMTVGVQGVAETASALAPTSAVVPAGADSVSALAAAGFAAHGAATQAMDAFAQQEICRLGAYVAEVVAEYRAADAAAAAIII